MTKYCRQPTRGFVAVVLRLDCSIIAGTKIWFEDAIYVYTSCKFQLQFLDYSFLTLYKAYMNEAEFVVGN